MSMRDACTYFKDAHKGKSMWPLHGSIKDSQSAQNFIDLAHFSHKVTPRRARRDS
jgi:hypothetical protein